MLVWVLMVCYPAFYMLFSVIIKWAIQILKGLGDVGFPPHPNKQQITGLKKFFKKGARCCPLQAGVFVLFELPKLTPRLVSLNALLHYHSSSINLGVTWFLRILSILVFNKRKVRLKS